MGKVHRVKNSNAKVISRFRLIPYAELTQILKEDGEAFLEGPFKRQTIWKATKKLSELVGKKVKVETALLRVQDGGQLEGYAFSLEH